MRHGATINTALCTPGTTHCCAPTRKLTTYEQAEDAQCHSPRTSVILQLAAGNVTVPVQGIIVGESRDYIRLRVGRVEIDIWKTMVRAIMQGAGSIFIN